MARIDDYKESFRLASIELKERDVATLAKAAGAEFSQGEGLIVPFLGARYIVQILPETDVRKENSNEEVPLPDKILIAHYLLGSSGKKKTGQLITFRQVTDGQFYFAAFQRRARDPFVNFFGNNGNLFVKCAAIMGASPSKNGDFGMEFTRRDKQEGRDEPWFVPPFPVSDDRIGAFLLPAGHGARRSGAP